MEVAAAEKKRGGCLTAFLILVLIANSLTALVYLGWLVAGRDVPNIPHWAIVVLAFGSVANVAFAVAVFKWKKWGVYGFGAMSLLALGVNLAIGLPLYSAAIGLLGIVILIVLVRPVWSQME